MKTPLAVIVGAGVAGLAAAWWLQHIGWRTIIVERSESLRDSGYMIGLSGPGYDTVTRMGLLPPLQSVSYEINENVYRDRRGRKFFVCAIGIFYAGYPTSRSADRIWSALCAMRSVSIRRSALAHPSPILYKRLIWCQSA